MPKTCSSRATIRRRARPRSARSSATSDIPVTYPVEVAGLLRANSRIAAHLGEGDSFRIGALDVVSALKSGLPHDDPRVLSARLEVGDGFARANADRRSAEDLSRRSEPGARPEPAGGRRLCAAPHGDPLSHARDRLSGNLSRRGAARDRRIGRQSRPKAGALCPRGQTGRSPDGCRGRRQRGHRPDRRRISQRSRRHHYPGPAPCTRHQPTRRARMRRTAVVRC